ncbi:VanZ family protein [Cytobacillus sp. NCCP-133]|uniref:VanZ family protein n=1 Tax=Cytobacillus sp. NCCP-133 TaxID=766848 RepID=UPI00222EF340|nr:VanZ family protein [Cytobacillus sp. NCCP-133]GLB60275.1 hypothetical protein NCCP133_24070 [Cytobacillus sp. NCCP-133]
MVAGILSVLYAFSTEFLQLFFQRDGRLFDILFDSAWIAAAILFIAVRKPSRHTAKKHLDPL